MLIPQSMTEKLLEERLLQLGAAVRRKTELVAFEQNQNEVQCVLLDAGGARKTVGAKYLVGCDGAHSIVRHGLGLPFPGNKDGLRWILADVELSGQKAVMKVVVQQGIESDLARKLVKMIKETKIKVQAAIQGEKLRVSGKKRDDLQGIIAMLKEASLDIPLQYNNFRD